MGHAYLYKSGVQSSLGQAQLLNTVCHLTMRSSPTAVVGSCPSSYLCLPAQLSRLFVTHALPPRVALLRPPNNQVTFLAGCRHTGQQRLILVTRKKYFKCSFPHIHYHASCTCKEAPFPSVHLHRYLDSRVIPRRGLHRGKQCVVHGAARRVAHLAGHGDGHAREELHACGVTGAALPRRSGVGGAQRAEQAGGGRVPLENRIRRLCSNT